VEPALIRVNRHPQLRISNVPRQRPVTVCSGEPRGLTANAGGAGAAPQGAVSVAPGVWMYQLTDKGLALDLTRKGTK
jgi:hypothetical protein